MPRGKAISNLGDRRLEAVISCAPAKSNVSLACGFVRDELPYPDPRIEDSSKIWMNGSGVEYGRVHAEGCVAAVSAAAR